MTEPDMAVEALNHQVSSRPLHLWDDSHRASAGLPHFASMEQPSFSVPRLSDRFLGGGDGYAI